MPETMQGLRRPVGRPPLNKPDYLLRQLRNDGWSIRRIAQAVNLSYGTVRRAFTKPSDRRDLARELARYAGE